MRVETEEYSIRWKNLEMKLKQINQRTSLFIYVIAFVSSFKNIDIYLIGDRADLRTVFNYVYSLLVLLVLIYLILIKAISNNHRLDRKLKYFVPLMLWVITKSTVVTVLTGVNNIPGTLIISFFTLFIIVLGVNDRKGFKNTVWAFSIGAVLSAIAPIFIFPEMIGSRATWFNKVNYPGGFWNNALISCISAVWIIIALVQREDSSKQTKVAIYFMIMITWLAAFAGLSRTLLLATLLSMLALLIFSKSFKRRLKFITIFILIMLALIVVFPDVFKSYSTRTIDNLSDPSNGRFFIWISYLKNLPKYILIGAVTNYRTFGPNGIAGPHSIFMNWLVQYGIIGLSGFLYLLYGMLKSISKVKKFSFSEAGFLYAWFVMYISVAAINQTGFMETSFFSAFAIILLWDRSNKQKTTQSLKLNNWSGKNE